MPKFEVLEHTADIGIRAFGSSLAELFENAALGVESIALDIDHVQPLAPYRISACGDDAESLLVNWLNEVIFYLDGRRIAMCRFAIGNITETEVSAEGWGEPRDPSRHAARLVVKAATYHQLRVAREGNGWLAEVFLDI